jgi:hypothetical protein
MTFKTKRPDGRSPRLIALDFLKTKSPDDVCSYQELGDVLGFHPRKERAAIQSAVRSANKTLLKLHQKGVEVADNGYRVVQPREHMLVASGHQNKADRALARALRWYENTDLSALTEVERKLHQGQHMLARAIFASHQHLDRRIKKLEDVLNAKVVEH